MADLSRSPGRRSWRWRGFQVQVELPAGLARRFRRRLSPPPPDETNLVLAETLPEIHVEHRDVESVLKFYFDPDAAASPEPPPDAPLAEQVAAITWYHTIELPGGITTPGFFDHRRLVPHYGLPASLAGKRAIDVATFDGFWAFELEHLGAAEVIAIDLARTSDTDMPPAARRLILDRGLDRPIGRGFEVAKRARGSAVQRRACSVYDLDPAEVGTFDFVHVADLLLHLERPLEALRRIRAVTAPDGEALIADSVALDVAGRLTEYLGGWVHVQWWRPSLDTLAQMVIDAGFGSVELRQIYTLAEDPSRTGEWRAVLSARP